MLTPTYYRPPWSRSRRHRFLSWRSFQRLISTATILVIATAFTSLPGVAASQATTVVTKPVAGMPGSAYAGEGAASRNKSNAVTNLQTGGNPLGDDVSNHQFAVDFNAVKSGGGSFAYVKATEGSSTIDGYFGTNYANAYNAGLIRGAYHFALPYESSGTAQADFFVNNGGGWSPDGKTLPPAIDVEYNPYQNGLNTCYNLSSAAWVSWLQAFSTEVHARTSRYPVIYSTADYWNTCLGNTTAFNATSPLWIACFNCSTGSPFPGDNDVFNGTSAQLTALALGSGNNPPPPPPSGNNVLNWGERDSNSAGGPNHAFSYGPKTAIALAGDWNGDGTSTPGALQNIGGQWNWALSNSNANSSPSYQFNYGSASCRALLGDWNGDGTTTPGVACVDGSQWKFSLTNSNAASSPSYVFDFGPTTCSPVTGDWNHDGKTTVGVACVDGSQWKFSLTNSNAASGPSYVFDFGPASCYIRTGDWNGDGYTTVGVLCPDTSVSPNQWQWSLTNTNAAGGPAYQFDFGATNYQAVVGDFNGDGITTIGVAGNG
jgi:GH25 family lysozyme M1 (1,4-beta-N-acetylmuramidase)